MNIYTSKNISLISVFLLLAVMSILVANRDLSVGADAIVYVYQFQWVSATGWSTNHEPGFSLLTWLIGNSTDDYRYYLAIVFLIMNLAFIYTLIILTGKDFSAPILFMFVGLSFFSSWYQVATLNGLRQGTSLPFLYMSFIFFQSRRYLPSILSMAAAVSFHYSCALAAPFFLLGRMKNRNIFIIFMLSSFLYASGLSELIIEFLSNLFSINAYNDIISYSEKEAPLWVGFQLNFFAYSVLWGVAYFIVSEYFIRVQMPSISKGCSVYLVMIMPYFYFAHGAFSNRYAMIGWLFIPFLHCLFFCNIPIFKTYLLQFSLFVLGSGCLYFVLLLNGVIS